MFAKIKCVFDFRYRAKLTVCFFVLLNSDLYAANLLDVYRYALEYDPSYESARQQKLSALPRAKQTWASVHPTLSLSAIYEDTERDFEPSDKTAPGGVSSSEVSDVGLNLEVPIFNRESWLEIRKSQKALSLSDLEYQLFDQKFIVKIASVYFDVLSSRDSLNSANANKKQIQEQLSIATNNYKAGIALVTDIRDAQSRYDLSIAEVISAENELNLSLLSLEHITGQRNLSLDIVPDDLDLSQTSDSVIDSWFALLDQHPKLKVAELEYELAKLDVKKAKASRWPTVSASATLGRDHLSGKGVGVFPGETDSQTYRLNFRMPLYSGLSTSNRMKELKYVQHQKLYDLRYARNSVREDAKRSQLEFRALKARLKALETAIESSKISLEAARLGYRAGVRNNLDVLDAQTQLFNAQKDLSKSKYNILIAILKLRGALGLLDFDDLVEVNKFLVLNN